MEWPHHVLRPRLWDSPELMHASHSLHKWQRIQPETITLLQQFYPCSTTLVAYKMNQSSCRALLCLTRCDLCSQEGYLRRHEPAVWDARLVSPVRHVSATSLLQYQRGLRATGRFHHRSWAWTQVRLDQMVSLVPEIWHSFFIHHLERSL